MQNYHRNANGWNEFNTPEDHYAYVRENAEASYNAVYSVFDNHNKIKMAVSNAKFDFKVAPLPPAGTSWLKTVRLYVANFGGIEYAESVKRIKAEREAE